MEKIVHVNLNGYDDECKLVPLEIVSGGDGSEALYVITAYCNDNENFKDFVNTNINSMYVYAKYFFEKYGDEGDNYSYEELKSLIDNNKDNLIWNATKIILNGELSSIHEFLKNNYQYINDKKIIISNILGVNNETYCNVSEYFSEFPNVLFNLEGNNEAVTLEDFKKTVDIIEGISKTVSDANLSPIEAAMYAYDLTRDRYYVAEDKSVDSLESSRDLTKVLLGDKIVCAGFTKIYNALLTKLDIPCAEFNINYGEDGGHMRTIALINDLKYNINGFYIFDPTWDCKRDENNSHLSGYKFFGKNYKQWEALELPDTKYDHLQVYDANMIDYLESRSFNGRISVIDLLPKLDIIGHNIYRKMLGMEKLHTEKSYDSEEIIKVVKQVMKLTRNHIKASDFVKILSNVRKVEYISNPDKYPYDYNSILVAALRSNLVSLHYEEQCLLCAIFGADLPNINENIMTKDEMIKLGRSLAVSDKIPEEIDSVKEQVNNGLTNIQDLKLKKTN